MLPPDPGRPHRRPAPRGRGDRGPCHRLRQAGQRRRRRLARPRLGRPVGRRHGAPGIILRDVAGALGEMARILGAKGANIVNLVCPPRRQLPHLPRRRRGSRPRPPARPARRAARAPTGSARSSGSRLSPGGLRMARPARGQHRQRHQVDALAVIGAICTGSPHAHEVRPEHTFAGNRPISLDEILADCSPGMIRMLAGPVRRLNG